MIKHPVATVSTLIAFLTGLQSVLFVSQASADLVDLVVVGTWQGHNTDPADNPFGITTGDRWVMKATYDDSSLFFRNDAFSGVVASLDPNVNPGTSFDVIVPHPNTNGIGPSPLVFDETDHVNIGFAPTAEIMFDGPSVASPGNFRNFEIHTDFQHFNTFTGVNQDFDFDMFFNDTTEEAAIFNITEGGSTAATAEPSLGNGFQPTLEVVTNDIMANAGGPYVFDTSNLSLNLNGTSGGGNGFGNDFDWTGPGGALANSPGPNIALGLAESGLTHTTDTDTIDLVVTENFTDFVSAAVTADVSYSNVGPNVLTASGVNELDQSIIFGATFDDGEQADNALVAGFEVVGIDFIYNGAVFLVNGGNVDLASLFGIFGDPGTFEVIARVTDQAGASDSLAFNIEVAPEPATLIVLALGFLMPARRRAA